MRISIVTISFNQAQFLEQALRSVVTQDWPDKEFIVVDPGSTDASRDIIGRYGAQIAVRLFEPDRGASDGLNKGFERASGDLLCFLNSDDEFLPGAFTRMARAFAARPDADFISGCGYFIDAQGARGRRIVPTRLTVDDVLHGSCTMFQQGTFFRRICWERAGGFNIENRSCWDGELFLQFLRAGLRQEILYEDIANFRIHGGSITGSGRLAELYRRDMGRMFAATKGRSRTAADDVVSSCLRWSKILRHPRSMLERLRTGPLPVNGETHDLRG